MIVLSFSCHLDYNWCFAFFVNLLHSQFTHVDWCNPLPVSRKRRRGTPRKPSSDHTRKLEPVVKSKIRAKKALLREAEHLSRCKI